MTIFITKIYLSGIALPLFLGTGHIMTGGIALLFIITFILAFLSFKILLNNKKSKFQSELKSKYQEFLTGVISNHYNEAYLEDVHEEHTPFLDSKDIRNPKRREILLTELISLFKMLNGNEKQRLKDLYMGFGFASEVPSKLKSPNWASRISAVYEIGAFQLTQYYTLLTPRLDDQNHNVRKAAFAKCTELKANPLNMLEHVHGKINRWEKHLISESLKSRYPEMIPVIANYKVLFPDHIEFLDELAIFYNQTDPKEISLLSKTMIKNVAD